MSSVRTKKASKMCGYLEKRGKWTIRGKWRKWWCVLEGQLLLYYKSRTQYLKLSPCCGSLNVALVKSVQPHTNRQIHMLTHSQLVILRASSKEKQQNWFLAFVNVLQKNRYEAFIPKRTNSRLKQLVFEQCDYCRNNLNAYNNDLHLQASQENNFDINFRVRIREEELMVENSQFENMRKKSFADDSKIDRINSNSVSWYEKSSLSATNGKRSSSHNDLEATTTDATQPGTDIRMKRFYSVQSITNLTGDVTTLSTEKSFSYRSIVRYNYSSPSHFTDGGYESHFKEENITMTRLGSEERTMCNHEVERKNSINLLKVFSNHSKQKDLINNELDTDIQTVAEKDEQTTVKVTETLQNHIENHSGQLMVEVEDESDLIVEENSEEKNNLLYSERYMSPTETTGFIRNSKRFLNYLPPRITDNVQFDQLPVLPAKQKVNSKIYRSKIAELSSGAYDSIGKSFEPDIRHSGPELDSLLQQLSMLTQQGLRSESPAVQDENKECKEDPDYDVPIPHASLIDRKFENNSSHNLRSENSFDFNMTPDSLEASWIRWSNADYMFDTSNHQSGVDDDVFLDSLTSHLRL